MCAMLCCILSSVSLSLHHHSSPVGIWCGCGSNILSAFIIIKEVFLHVRIVSKVLLKIDVFMSGCMDSLGTLFLSSVGLSSDIEGG